MKEKILYSITTEDIMTVSEENNIPFTKQDLPFLADKIGDFMGDQWHGAIEYALEEIKRSRYYGVNKGTQKSHYRNNKNLSKR